MIKCDKILEGPLKDVIERIFRNIFQQFVNIQSLNFTIIGYFPAEPLPVNISSLSLISSNLFELNICVYNFDDCFYLLDGRFPNLSTLDIRVYSIESSRSTVDHKVDDFE